MSVYNNCSFIGRITKAPELNVSKGDKEYVAFSLAVQRDFKDNKGNYGVDFVDLIAWGTRAKFIAKYVTPKDVIGVNGTVMTSMYKDEKSGNNIKNVSFNVGNVSIVSYGNKKEDNDTQDEDDNEPNNDIAQTDDAPF
jgi:single-strand DNA-binding protein